jgi:hypothetical protein
VQSCKQQIGAVHFASNDSSILAVKPLRQAQQRFKEALCPRLRSKKLRVFLETGEKQGKFDAARAAGFRHRRRREALPRVLRVSPSILRLQQEADPLQRRGVMARQGSLAGRTCWASGKAGRLVCAGRAAHMGSGALGVRGGRVELRHAPKQQVEGGHVVLLLPAAVPHGEMGERCQESGEAQGGGEPGEGAAQVR